MQLFCSYTFRKIWLPHIQNGRQNESHTFLGGNFQLLTSITRSILNIFQRDENPLIPGDTMQLFCSYTFRKIWLLHIQNGRQNEDPPPPHPSHPLALAQFSIFFNGTKALLFLVTQCNFFVLTPFAKYSSFIFKMAAKMSHNFFFWE